MCRSLTVYQNAEACGLKEIFQMDIAPAQGSSEVPKILFLAILAASSALRFERRQGMLFRSSSSSVDAAVMAMGMVTLIGQAKHCLEVCIASLALSLKDGHWRAF